MNVLITGSSGFIGSNLLKLFMNTNYNVLALYNQNKPKKKLSRNIKYLKFDLQKMGNFFIIKKFKPNVVIHLAWKGIPNFSYRNSNLNLKLSTRFLIEISKLKSCRKLIVAGSSFEKNIKEDNKYFVWAKVELKKNIEKICKNKNIDFGWFRIFYVFGNGQRKKSLIPYIINSFKNKKIPIIKNLNNANDFVYIDDVTNIFFNAINKKLNGNSFDIGSGKLTPVWKICILIEKIIFKENIYFQDILKKKNKINKKNPKASLNKLKKYFKFYSPMSINQSLNKMIQENIKL